MGKLADKRVAIIGTGATAVQCVPHLARDARELYVFQRTPSSVDMRGNHPIDPDWFAGIATPGWQQRWLENFTANQAGGGADEDLVQDGWTDIARRIRARIAALPPEELGPAAMRPPTRSPTSRRWRRSVPAPTPSCGTPTRRGS